MEPTKNTAPSAAEPTRSAKPGNGATMKQTDPIANRTPIHHEAGRADVRRPSAASTRESCEECLRWNRDSQIAVLPSVRR